MTWADASDGRRDYKSGRPDPPGFAPVASKVLTPWRVGMVEEDVDSKRETPARGRDADEPKLGGKLPPRTAKLAVPPGSICMVPAQGLSEK